jgi:hypothetical protein
MLGIDQPAGEAEPVFGLVSRERRQCGRRVGLHGCAPLIVLAALEDIGHLGLWEVPHDHDFRGPFGEIVAAATGRFEGRPLGRRFVGEGRGEVVADGLGIAFLGEGRRDRARRGKIPHLEWRERTSKHAEVIHEAVLEAVVARPLADRDGVATAAGDLAGEAVADDRGGGRMTVHEDREPRGLA